MAKIINGISYNMHGGTRELSELSPAETAAVKLNTQIISQIIKARNTKGLTQKELEKISGVSQPLIARIEKGNADPQITTVLRMLEPLGMTLAVVPKEQSPVI